MQPVTLTTARLELWVVSESDIDAVFAACQDADIQRYTTVPSPYTRQHAVDFVAKAQRWWAEGTEATWAVRHEGALAGMIGLHRLGSGSGELGYWMTRETRGRGLLTEAARTVIDWGFSSDGLGLARIEWRAVAGNTASARAARTLGFRFEGTLRAALARDRDGDGGTAAAARDDSWIAGLLPADDRTPQPWPVLAD